MSRRNPLLLFFGLLYFVQGVVQAYQVNFFKPHMSSEGIDADQIALVASVAVLPFILKALLGLLSDRVDLFGLGHRKPYLLIGLTGCAAAFVMIAFLDPSANFALFGGVVVAMTCMLVLFDTTADAYAVEVIDEPDQGRVQSYMTSGRALGLILLSVVFGQIANRASYAAIFPVIALLLLAPLLLVWRMDFTADPNTFDPNTFDPNATSGPNNRGDTATTTAFQWSAFAAFVTPRNLAFSASVILAWFFYWGIDSQITFYMAEQLAIDDGAIGNFGSIKGLGMVVGAATTAYLVGRIGPMRTAGATVALVTAGGLTLPSLSAPTTLLLFAGGWGVISGLHWTVYTAVSMRLTDLRIAGTMFALFQTMANIGIAASEGIATSRIDDIGFASVFQSLAIGNAVALPIIVLIIHRATAPARSPTSSSGIAAAS